MRLSEVALTVVFFSPFLSIIPVHLHTVGRQFSRGVQRNQLELAEESFRGSQ